MAKKFSLLIALLMPCNNCIDRYHRWASKFAVEGGHKLSFVGGGHKNFAPGGGRGGSVDENFGTFS